MKVLDPSVVSPEVFKNKQNLIEYRFVCVGEIFEDCQTEHRSLRKISPLRSISQSSILYARKNTRINIS